MSDLIFFLFIIIGAIIHEYAHGWTADKLGDPTARNAGRLTLNPLAHIDIFGTIILPFLMVLSFGSAFGYAKPVPYNPYNLRNQKIDPALIGLSGPLSNLILALIFTLIIRLSPYSTLNLILSLGVLANLALLIFNLIPIPPLDGSKLLYALLPADSWRLKASLEKYGIFILIFFIFSLSRLISPLIFWCYQLLMP
ncbi:MAG TPA: site-2 protease family protein [bacterium]|nr:site-2 protease family protein [bacterium]HPL95381.1 site-2 protease family protein [bacterium]